MSITPMYQTFTWRKATGSGLYGPTYTDYENQKCRYTEEMKSVPNPKGGNDEITSTALLRTMSAVQPGDFVIYNSGTPRPVLAVLAPTGVGGQILEYEVRL